MTGAIADKRSSWRDRPVRNGALVAFATVSNTAAAAPWEPDDHAWDDAFGPNRGRKAKGTPPRGGPNRSRTTR